jgi:hypothetical protein
MQTAVKQQMFAGPQRHTACGCSAEGCGWNMVEGKHLQPAHLPVPHAAPSAQQQLQVLQPRQAAPSAQVCPPAQPPLCQLQPSQWEQLRNSGYAWLSDPRPGPREPAAAGRQQGHGRGFCGKNGTPATCSDRRSSVEQIHTYTEAHAAHSAGCRHSMLGASSSKSNSNSNSRSVTLTPVQLHSLLTLA